MSKIDKLIERLLSKPNDFSWAELEKLLSHYGYSEVKTGKTGGSRRKFADRDGHIISLHKPHPKEILKQYQIKDVIDALRERGLIDD